MQHGKLMQGDHAGQGIHMWNSMPALSPLSIQAVYPMPLQLGNLCEVAFPSLHSGSEA